MARFNAGYRTATDAVKAHGWNKSTYLAHERGQNKFSVEDAGKYAIAYGVRASWLLVGDDSKNPDKNPKNPDKNPMCNHPIHNHNCIDRIFALALLLRDEPDSRTLIAKLDECVQSQKQKLRVTTTSTVRENSFILR